jgi:signal transduction histidine kinase
MRERARAIDAHFDVRSEAGGGTRLSLVFPQRVPMQ